MVVNWIASLNLRNRLIIGFAVLLNIGLVIAFQLFSFNEQTNEACATQYPNSFIARVQCIHRMDAQEKKNKEDLELKESQRIKTNSARACIAENIGRIESVVKRLQESTDENLTLAQLKPIFNNILKDSKAIAFSLDSSIVPANDDIKERVLVTSIYPLCETSFNLLVNVRAAESGKIDSFKVWAINPPTGYFDGQHYEFTVDYETRRMAKEAEVKGKKSTFLDPCAPGLKKADRISRLAQYGAVRQDSEFEYSAANHRVTFERYYPYGALASCY
jgi:hypothetical protein